MTRALRREAIGLLLLLFVWELALGYLRSSHALRTLAVGRRIADLTALAGDRLRPGDGALHLRAGTKPPSISRLPGVELEPGKRYLLAVRAAAGRGFSLQLIDRDDQASVAKLRLAERGETEELLLPIELERLPSSNRLEIWNPTAVDLVIYDLRFHELRPGLGRSRAAVWLLGPLALSLFAWRHRRSLVGFLRAGRGESGPDARLWDGVVAVAFFLVCFHLFFAAPVEQILDSKYSSAVSQRLITAGTLALPETYADGESLPYMLQRVGDRIFHLYPNAVAVLNVPFVALFDALGEGPIGADGSFLRHRENRILAFAAAFQAAALCALLYALARLYLRPLPALAMASLFAFGTQIFSSVSRPYWSHSWALLLMAAATYLLLSPAFRERTSSYVLGASLLSWSFFCRPPMSLSILGLVAYLAVTRRRHLRWFAVAGLVWGALFVAYSLHTYQSPIPPYFLARHLESGVLGVESLQTTYPGALAGTLVSPGRGLFVYVPFLALVLIAGVRYWRQLPEKSLILTALGVCLAHWQLVSASRAWGGGQSFGPRLFSDVLVWLFLLTLFVTLTWIRGWSGRRVGVRGIQIAGAALLVAASLSINYRGGTARETYRWKGYSLWDWRHPQFMAGLVPVASERPLEERIAALTTRRDAAERRLVTQTILEDESVERRLVGGVDRVVVGVTWDKWTRGDQPAALVVRNRTAETSTPGLKLAVWAARDEYPITVFVEDGEELRRYRYEERGARRIELAPVPASSQRLYLIWSDKAWSPGTRDSRALGVQLLPPD